METQFVGSRFLDGKVKSSVCKARDPGKAEAYLLYVEHFHGERNAADGLLTTPSTLIFDCVV